MRAHFLVPLLALLLTSLLHADGKPLKEHGAEDESFAKEENNEEVHESKDDEEIEEIGKKKSSIETELEKGRKDNDNKIDSESKTERLIDELSDTNSADERKRAGQVKNEVEEVTKSSVDKKDDIVETNEENTDDEKAEKKGEIETEDNADTEDASEVSDTRRGIVSEKPDDEDPPVKKHGVSGKKEEGTKETGMEKVKVEKKSKAGKKSKTGSAARKRDEPECCHHEAEHEGEHCCHDGDACCHEAEHGHHEGKEQENTHNNHDHGYEFYEEWGEHGGHEGEHEAHHTGEDEGDHEHHHEGEHHGHHDHHDHDHEHENEHSEDKDTVPKRKDKVTTNTKKKEALPNSKKWWMVGDSKQWGGKGHDHWGPPEDAEQEGWHGHGHGHGGHSEGHQKAHIPECCKTSTQKADKRCHCPHITSHGDHHGEEGGGEEGGEQNVPGDHAEGYHFHERGHGGHNDHDHDLRGPWSFGYDGFGDDWPDWDHNQKEFEHLQELDRESHEGEHDVHDIPEGHHHTCKGHGHQRSCLRGRYPGVGLVAPITPPMGGPLPYGMPISLMTLPLPAPPSSHARHPYRVCHDCHILKNGGSRCLCKAIKHHASVEQSTDYIHHVYIDCDAIVHNYPHGRKNHQVCFHRADIPTPEVASHKGGKAKQGVVYPYVGYGPWSAYPWWGDWWGGHGNHGWGQQGADCHKCENDHHGCECAHHDEADHDVDVEHGPSLVHDHDGHHNHPDEHAIGFHGEGSHLRTYRCHDTVEAKKDDSSTKSRRFCVPMGYHGGYGWPYWHGYPGVGTGLWGWGWPWIKNKVPGSKMQDKGNNGTQPTPEPGHISKKNFIEEIPIKANNTKKQTIHVGYGYASGDNYRLGYGFGGMGGVAGFAPIGNGIDESTNQAPYSRSTIEGEDLAAITFAKSHIPKPEKEKTVTGSKRGIDREYTGENTASNE